LDTVIKLVKGVFKDYKAVILYIAAFVLSVFFKASPMLIVLGAGLIAFALYRPPKTKAPPAAPVNPPPEREGKK
jgi:chromate transporter